MYPGTYAATTPDKPAVIMAETGQTQSYAELDDNSARLARVLYDAGLRRGDVIALLAENNVRYFEVYWAALRSGLYITAINRHLSPDEVAYIVQDSGARALIASAGLRELAEAVVPLTPKVELRFAFDGTMRGFSSYEDVLAMAGERLAAQPLGAPMLYSSGTTGRPKGIKQPLKDMQVGEPGGELMVPLFQHLYKLGADDVYLVPAPLYHAAPLRWAGVMHALGATLVVMERFDAEKLLAAVEKYRVTVTQMVPTMFVRLLKLPEDVRTRYDVSKLRVVVHAAAPCPVDVKRRIIDWFGPIVHEYYGSTEGNGGTFIDTEQWLRKPGSVGQSALGPIHICDDDGNELPPGSVGTIYFERDVMPFEYHNDPAKTKAGQHPDHPLWTTVGDIGYVDDEQYLFLTDRKSFVIISGGVNIYPQEIENALTMHPAVYDVAVIGRPDPVMGEQVTAVIAVREGVVAGPDLADELIAYARTKVSAFKAPRAVEFVEELPRTPTGKLVKRTLVDQIR